MNANSPLSFKEKYWRYSLFAILIGLGLTIFIELIPFMGGLLGAATLYILLRGQMFRLTGRRKWKRSMAALLLLLEAILCFLIPISLAVWMLVGKVQDITLDPKSILDPVEHLIALIREKTGYDPMQKSNLNFLIGLVPRIGQWVMGSIGSFAINVVVLLFVLYFMLIGGRRMENYCRDILPFDHADTADVLREIHMIVRSNAIVIPLLAIIQGFVAYVGYVIFDVPSAVFWGVLTCFATIIPIVGTALVWFPLALYLAMAGEWGYAVGLVVYAGLVITHVDNLVRFVMQKKIADTHPLITIFGVFIGLSLFGFMGVIFGPLLLSMFVLCFHIFKKRYLDTKGVRIPLQPAEKA